MKNATLFILLSLSAAVSADMTYSVSAMYGQTLEQGSDNAPVLRLSIGSDESDLYLWGSYENKKSRLLGQSIAKTSLYGLGVGYRHSVTDKLYVAGELGYMHLDNKVREHIQQEIIFTDLVGTHHVDSRPIPVAARKPYQQDNYSTTWEVDNAITGRLAVGYKVNARLSYEFAYRPLIVKELVELYDQERRDAGRGYWMESRTHNYSTVEVGFLYSF